MPEAKAAKVVGAQQRLADILAAAKLADVSGLDVFAVGEHHRLDMAISATPVVLAAIAAVTERIRLASQLRCFRFLKLLTGAKVQ
jgi:alkanesulfonate monooxygenase SsuD/methylene tetrahydromethanopterin reductase-like flavin-dependent oxidoreductase (luciferase family)